MMEYLTLANFSHALRYVVVLALLINSLWVLRAALGSLFEDHTRVTNQSFFIVPGHALLTLLALTFIV